MEDTKGILFSTNLASGWAAGINFLSIKSSLLNESAEELQSYNGNSISFFLEKIFCLINFLSTS